jgi:DASS family divalent anion:Na+ symporter
MFVSTIQNDKLTTSALQTSGVFLTVMLSLMFTNYPISIIVCTALSTLVLLKSLMCQTESGLWILCNQCSVDLKCDALKDGFKTSLLGYSNPISWMILCAFMIGQAVDKTGLGKRLSLLLMKNLGGNLLGLGYAIFISEFVLSAFVPSNTARGGGIIMPIVMSLVETLGSTPDDNANIGYELINVGNF